MRTSRVICGVAVAIAALLSAAGPAAAAPVTLDFESGVLPGQQVTNQYGFPSAPAGPTFGKGTDAGFTGIECPAPYLLDVEPAASGTRYLAVGCVGGEQQTSGAFFHLGYSTHEIEFNVGIAGATAAITEIWTTAFRADHSIVQQQQTLLPPQSSPVYKVVPLISAADDIAYVAVERGTKSTPSGSATGVTLTSGHDLLVDDLTYNPPSSPPDSSFSIGANPASAQIAAGQQQSIKIPVSWTNNPDPTASPVSLELTSAPAGVTGDFVPNPTTSGTSTLTLHVAKTAVAKPDYTVTVTGYVDKGSPSEKHSSVVIPLRVTAPFVVNQPGDVALAACTPAQVGLRVAAAPQITDPFTFSVELKQPGASIAAISPGQVVDAHHATATVTPQNGEALATLTLSVPPGTPPASGEPLKITASESGYADQTTESSVSIITGTVGSVQSNGLPVTTVSTPELGIPGTLLTLGGSGFCPGTKVTIGNDATRRSDDHFAAPAQSISSDGRTLTVRVPRGAMTGPLHIVRPDGQDFFGPALTVRSFRNTFGFSWVNKDWGGRLSGDLVDELFGQNETNIDISGWLIRKPEATFYEAVTNKHIPGGICFGMVYASIEMRDFPQEIGTFARTGGNSVWNLDAKAAPSKPLLDYVTARFSLQFSDQLIPIELNQILGQGILAHNAGDDLTEIQSELAKGPPVMIGLVHWKDISPEAHTVLAYDTEPLPDGSTAVDIYNPNVPYDTQEQATATAHDASEFTNSRIVIDPSGHWKLAELGWEGPDANLLIFKHADLPIINGKRPKLPNLFTSAALVVFGSSGDGVTQLGGEGGGELFQGGQIAAPKRWPKGVAPLAPFTGHAAPLQLAGVDPKKSRALDATVRRSGGGGAMQVRLPGLQADLHAGVANGQVDHLKVDPRTGVIGYVGGAPSTPLSGDLVGAPAGAAAHTSATATERSRALTEHAVHFATTSGKGGDKLSFPAGRELVIDHRGAAATLTLALSAYGPDGRPVAVELPPLRLARGSRLTVAPRDWRHLAGSAIAIRGGRAGRRVVHGRRIGSRFAAVRRVKLTARAADVSLAVRRPPAGARLALAVSIRRRGHKVASGTPTQLGGRALRTGRVRVALGKRLPRGRYEVSVRLLEVSGRGAAQGSVVVARTLATRL